jgi:hypothetical protein
MSRLTRVRRAALAALAALGVVIALGAADVSPALASAHPAAATASYLYVLQAREGWVTKRPNGHWRLSLRGVSAFAFTDRPVRLAKSVRVHRLVSQWSRLFGGSAPNGAFVVQHAPAGQPPTAVEILKAFWEKPGQLALCMCTIGSQPKAVQWLRQLTRTSAARHGEITIFIDGGLAIQYAGDRGLRRSARRSR